MNERTNEKQKQEWTTTTATHQSSKKNKVKKTDTMRMRNENGGRRRSSVKKTIYNESNKQTERKNRRWTWNRNVELDESERE